MKVRLRPKRSAIRPPSSSRLPNASAYAVTTHCRSSSEKPRSRWARRQRDVHDGRVEHDHQLGDADDARGPASGGHGAGLGRVASWLHNRLLGHIGWIGFVTAMTNADEGM